MVEVGGFGVRVKVIWRDPYHLPMAKEKLCCHLFASILFGWGYYLSIRVIFFIAPPSEGCFSQGSIKFVFFFSNFEVVYSKKKIPSSLCFRGFILCCCCCCCLEGAKRRGIIFSQLKKSYYHYGYDKGWVGHSHIHE